MLKRYRYVNVSVNYEEVLHASGDSLKEALALAQAASLKNFGMRVLFYTPSFAYYRIKRYSPPPDAFPSISITGSYCALRCKHCEGKTLRTMYPATSPRKLLELCAKLKRRGAIGCLISGGCSTDGSVPLEGFIDAISKVKRELGLIVTVHTGLVNYNVAKRLKEAGVDSAMLDVIGSDETIKDIYHLNASVADFERSLRALHEVGIPSVPHVVVGLHYGRLSGELRALQAVEKCSPSAVVIIVFTPIRGTAMEGVHPPKPEDVAKVLTIARLMLQKTPVILGCMRPKGEYRARVDELALRAGVNAIAFPTEGAIKLVESLGYEITFSPVCCSQAYVDVKSLR